jgi:hypothetical protein
MLTSPVVGIFESQHPDVHVQIDINRLQGIKRHNPVTEKALESVGTASRQCHRIGLPAVMA